MHPQEGIKPAEDYMERVLHTWTRRNIKPKFHVSEQRPDARTGAHSDMIETIPSYLLDIPEKYGIDIDIMIEAKLKEQAIRYLYNKYTHLDPEYLMIKKIKATFKKVPLDKVDSAPKQRIKARVKSQSIDNLLDCDPDATV